MKSNNSLKIKFSLIIAFALSFLITVGAFMGITLASANRTVSISSSGLSIFKDASNSNAPIWAHQEGEGDDKKDFVMFVFEDDDSEVNYKKNLAFKWYENAEKTEVTKDEDDKEVDTTVGFTSRPGWFNMEIGFADQNNTDGNLQFEKFVITFESQQYTQTKDGKTTNYIVFEKTDDNKLKVYVATKDAAEKDLDAVLDRLANESPIGTVDSDDSITINFTDYTDGNYTVQVGELANTGTFENVGKTYSKYSSSTTKSVTPLSFKAIFAKGEDGESVSHDEAFMTLYTLNNQSFELSGLTETDHGAPLTKGSINDDMPPVVCLDKAVPFIKYNGEITFDYTVIDVVTTSPSLTTSYYMLTKDGKTPEYKTQTGGDYRTVTDSDDQYIFPHGNHYQPISGTDYNASVYDENFEVKAAVKVVLKLTDTSSTGGQTTYVLLDWYVDSDYLIKLNGDENKKYIAVTTDEQGLSYAYTNGTASNPDDPDWQSLLTAYQTSVNDAAKDLKAGSKNYFYLPSVKNLFNTDATPYSDLTFSIYYNNGSQQSSTNKSANELSINLTKAGKYIFTVYAKDAAGNNMYYYDDENEKVDLVTGDIWNMYKQEDKSEYAGMRKYLPWFEFTVEESEISIEEPDEQSTAYVGSSYTPDSFEINGVSVKTAYTLYEFQNDLWATAENGGVAMTFKYFSENKEDLLKNSRQYFTRIRPASELKEGTADYDRFNDYGWNGTSLSFTPQTANAFYIIKCEASSSETAEPVTKLMTIAAAPKVATLKGEDTWVQDNATSIVLLCIAGASLIGIILLLVIKPKNKGDIDEVTAKPKKKNRK